MGNKFCSSCGKPIDMGALFCAHCGAKQGAPPQAPPAATPGQYAPVPQGKPPKKIWPLVTALSVLGVAVAAALVLMFLGVIKIGGAAPVAAVATPTPPVQTTTPMYTATPVVTAAPDIEEAIVGRWEYTDGDGVTYSMAFESNGTCSMYSSEDYDTYTGRYTFNGALLAIIEDGYDISDAVYLNVIMGTDQLTLIDPETGQPRVFTPSQEAEPIF